MAFGEFGFLDTEQQCLQTPLVADTQHLEEHRQSEERRFSSPLLTDLESLHSCLTNVVEMKQAVNVTRSLRHVIEEMKALHEVQNRHQVEANNQIQANLEQNTETINTLKCKVDALYSRSTDGEAVVLMILSLKPFNRSLSK